MLRQLPAVAAVGRAATVSRELSAAGRCARGHARRARDRSHSARDDATIATLLARAHGPCQLLVSGGSDLTSDRCCAAVLGANALERLAPSETDVDAAGLQQLWNALRHLASLGLDGCRELVSDEVEAVLVTAPAGPLRRLSIASCRSLSDRIVARLCVLIGAPLQELDAFGYDDLGAQVRSL